MNRNIGFMIGGAAIILSSFLSDKGMLIPNELKFIAGVIIFGYGLINLIMKSKKEK